MIAVKTYYKLYPLYDRPRLLDTHEDAMAAVKTMRNSNRGFFLYEVKMQDNKKQMVFISGWNPKA